MTASAVSAIDFGNDNHYPEHNTRNFVDLLWNYSGLPTDSSCWVSYKCFQPQIAVNGWMLPALAQYRNLQVFLNTVVTGVQRDSSTGAIVGVTAVQRTAVSGTGWDRLLSEQLEDWYSPTDSTYFTKQVHQFAAADSASPDHWVVIEATEFGDVFGAGQLPFAQGIEALNETDSTLIDYCGQGTTIDFYLSYGLAPAPTPDPFPPGDGEGEPFDYKNYPWSMVWSYRRVVSLPNASDTQVVPGETSLQNWAGGNDYDTGYLFLPIADALAQQPWKGGINMTALAQAEQRAYGWYHFYKQAANASIGPYLTLNTTMSGTSTGLAKMPYLRDARRAPEGIQGFKLTYAALNTTNRPQYPRFGTYWNDTIAIGQYNSDIHSMKAGYCPTPSYLQTGKTLPYYLPYRALTHSSVPNLLVAGKNMAQSFWANAATRLHPEEWSTGTAAGVAAGLMVERGWWRSEQVYTVDGAMTLLQARLEDTAGAVGQPLRWSDDE